MAEGYVSSKDRESAGESLDINIGLLVRQYHHFLRLVWPFVLALQNVAYILSWESPQTTVQVWLLMLLMCFSIGKYCLLLLSMTSVGFVAAVGWLCHVNHILVKDQFDLVRASPTYPSNVYRDIVLDDSAKSKIEVERRKKTLLDFRVMLRDLLAVVNKMCQCLESLYDLLSWRQTQQSAIFFTSLTVGILSIFLLPVSLSLSVEVCLVFGANPFFLRLLQSMDVSEDSDDIGQDVPDGVVLPPTLPTESNQETITVDPLKDHFTSSTSTDISQKDEPFTDFTRERGETVSASEFSTSGEKSLEGSWEPNHVGVPESGECYSCQAPVKTFSNKRRYCRHCGNHFCPKCCSKKLPKSALGATSPTARKEKVLVCHCCWTILKNQTQDQKNGFS